MSRLSTSLLAWAILILSQRMQGNASATIVHWSNLSKPAIERSTSDRSDYLTVGFSSSPSAAGLCIDRLDGKIYWTVSSGIKRSDLDGKNVETVVTGLTQPRAIEVDHAAGYVYWSEVGVGVRRSMLDGSNIEDIAVSGTVLGIALDLVHNKVYWSDTDADIIRRANLDGSSDENVVVLTEGGLVGPMDLALDPYAGRIYWTEFGLQEIRTAFYNGALMQTLYDPSDGIRSPDGIGIDLTDGTLYWAEAGTGRIRRGDVFGTQTEIAFEPGGGPRALTVEASGDFNGDGQVTGADLVIWQEAFCFDPFLPVDMRADSDLNGVTDGKDFLIWQRKFGAGGGGAVADSFVIPEPSGLAIVCIGTAFLAAVGWKRRRFSKD